MRCLALRLHGKHLTLLLQIINADGESLQNVSVLPLHGGRAPRWLFPRMVKLAGLIAGEVIESYGESELIARLADPHWFQALSCAIGYDWHSSGTTTVTMGAIKEALNFNYGIFIAGGKGKQGLLTPEQIESGADYLSIGAQAEKLKHYSKMLAKIDSALIYDDIGIYHHTIAFSRRLDWAVVQQAMHAKSGNAIRFQACSGNVDMSDITNETNGAVISRSIGMTMDMTFADNSQVKDASLKAIEESVPEILRAAGKPYVLPQRHEILPTDLPKNGRKLLSDLDGMHMNSYAELLSQKGMGRKTIRSLALISSLIYDKRIAERDPVMYSYNLGGKDGIPYRINLRDYDSVVNEMKGIISGSSIEQTDKRRVLASLSKLVSKSYYGV